MIEEQQLDESEVYHIRKQKLAALRTSGFNFPNEFRREHLAADLMNVHANIEKDAQGFIITDAEMRTNIPGMFAAGDIRSKLCRQIATAVGDGATAACAARYYIQEATK